MQEKNIRVIQVVVLNLGNISDEILQQYFLLLTIFLKWYDLLHTVFEKWIISSELILFLHFTLKTFCATSRYIQINQKKEK